MYDTGGRDDIYNYDEKYYYHFNCTAGALMTVKINLMDMEKGFVLSNTTFLPDFIPQNFMNTNNYVYVGTGSSDDDSNLLREMKLSYSDLYLVFYSDGSGNF